MSETLSKTKHRVTSGRVLPDPYVLGVSPGRRLERAAQAVAQAAPDCRKVELKGHVSVPVELMAALQEACDGGR